jgi:hypothetical protein
MNRENLRAEDVARISLRLALIVLGVFIVVLGVFFFVVGRLGTAYSDPSALRGLAYALPMLVVGGLLVTSSRWLALRLYGPERPGEEDVARIFLRIALIALGVFVVALGVLFFFLFWVSAQMMTDYAGPTAIRVLIQVLPLLVIGALLVTLSRWLAVLLYRPERPAPEDVARIFLRLALIVMGVFVVIVGILVLVFVMLLAQHAQDSVWSAALGALSYVLPLLVIGALLATFSRWLAVLLYRQERPGAGPPQPDTDPLAVCPSCGVPYNPGDYDADAPAWLCGRCGTRLGP